MKKTAFKLRSGNSPLFKSMGSSPIQDHEEGHKEKMEQPVTESDIVKQKTKQRKNKRKTIIKDPNTGERIKVKEEYDNVLGWHQVGIGVGKKGKIYDLDEIKANTQKENIIKDIGSEDNLFSTLDLIKSSKNPNWWSGNLKDWRDPKWTPARAFKEKKMREVIKLYGIDHPITRQIELNLKGPPRGFKY